MNPEQPTPPPQKTVVHVTRALDPEQPVISPEIQAKHDASKEQFPFLNLSPGEYVVAAVRRHPIGLLVPLFLGTVLILFAFIVLTFYPEISVALALSGPLAEVGTMAIPILIFIAVVGFAMFVAYYVYVNNKFFLTNESVIQEIQLSLFSRLEQTVSLANIEDASFTQLGIFQQIFNYGNIRLSTEGDETTYRFSYVASPKDHIAQLNNAVEAFKNGRPVLDN
jgi:uncharacterized membrane protein YdbT with pleckstrin-like domain